MGPSPRNSDSISLWWYPGLSIAEKLPGDSVVDSGLWTGEFHQPPHCTDGETEAMRTVALQWSWSLWFSRLTAWEGLCDSWRRAGTLEPHSPGLESWVCLSPAVWLWMKACTSLSPSCVGRGCSQDLYTGWGRTCWVNESKVLPQSWAHSGAGTLLVTVPGILSHDSGLCAEVPSREACSAPSWPLGSLPHPPIHCSSDLVSSPGVVVSPHFPSSHPSFFVFQLTKSFT